MVLECWDLTQAYAAALSHRKAEAEAASASGSGGGGGGGDASAAGLPAGLKLESEAALLQPGKKDGEMKVVREAGSGVVYSWDAAKCARPSYVTALPSPGHPARQCLRALQNSCLHEAVAMCDFASWASRDPSCCAACATLCACMQGQGLP